MDGRKNNGNKGHSTKAKKADDKRTNQYKTAIRNACTIKDVELLLKRCHQIALSDDRDRLTALKTYLEYTLGKPAIVMEEETADVLKGIKIDMANWK